MYIQAAVVLHNLFVEWNDEGDKDWIDWDDFSSIDSNLGEDDDYHRVCQPIADGEPGDERRRRLTAFLNEVHVL
jgi:hypothetical protein